MSILPRCRSNQRAVVFGPVAFELAFGPALGLVFGLGTFGPVAFGRVAFGPLEDFVAFGPVAFGVAFGVKASKLSITSRVSTLSRVLILSRVSILSFNSVDPF